MGLIRPFVFGILLTVVASPDADAQCLAWDDTFGVPGVVGASVNVCARLDLGSGPQLFVAGSFSSIDGIPAASVARRTGTSWSARGPGPGITVQALAVFDEGAGPVLFAAGSYQWAIRRWNGASWSMVGGGLWGSDFSFGATDLVVHDDGSGAALYVCGAFKNAGLTSVNNVARWNGVSWSALGNGLSEGVGALAVFDDGQGAALYAAGTLSPFAGGPAGWIAKWNGTSWTSVTGAGFGSTLGALEVFDDGSGLALYAGGQFTEIAGVTASSVARWNGSIWSPLSSGIAGAVREFCVFDDASTGPALYVGGSFSSAGGVPANNLARWDGVTWSALGAGTNGAVYALEAADDGRDADVDLVVGGIFTEAAGQASARIALWEGCATRTFCFGDGVSAACPCANNGLPGRGCENSAATGGAVVSVSGTAVPDTAVLTSESELANALSIFLQGDLALPSPALFGDGLRCAGGNLKRLYVENAVGGTVSAPDLFDPSITLRSTELGDPIAPGSTRVYQVYYRDPDLAFCPSPQGASFNASNALSVVW